MIDIIPGSMNMDHNLIEAAIRSKTRVIVPVHYASVACDMDPSMALAKRHNILVMEDAASSLAATYKSRTLGSFGHLFCFSFHETKIFTAGGQGGAIAINDLSLVPPWGDPSKQWNESLSILLGRNQRAWADRCGLEFHHVGDPGHTSLGAT